MYRTIGEPIDRDVLVSVPFDALAIAYPAMPTTAKPPHTAPTIMPTFEDDEDDGGDGVWGGDGADVVFGF